MLRVHYFTFNPFQENTYIISDDQNNCWVIDPGMYTSSETDQLIHYFSDNNFKPKGVINTHAHIDHILGVQALIDRYDIPFYLHQKESPILSSAAVTAQMFGLNLPSIPRVSGYINEHEPLLLGDETLEILFVPGHSPGSVALYHPAGKWAICGDTLFAGSIGRTDLPGGDYDTLINSIQTKLLVLPGDTAIYPGHGPSTTVVSEKNGNPFLQ